MEQKPPDTALLEVDDVSGGMDEDAKTRLYAAITAALGDTRRFRLLPRAELPEVAPHGAAEEPEALLEAFAVLPEIAQIFLPRFEDATSPFSGRRSWRFSLTLYDARDGRRLSLRQAWLDQDSAEDSLKWTVYEFADPLRFEELARGHRFAALAATDPEGLRKDPEFLRMVLLTHLQRGSWEAAATDAESLLAVKPEDAPAWHGKALALHRAGRTGDAKAAVERALALQPNPESWLLKGDIDAHEGRGAAALESYRAAAALEGADGARARAKLSSLERFLGEPDAPAILRLGWMWGYLGYVGVMLKGELSEELQTHLLSVASEIESQFRRLTSVHLARIVGLEAWNAWVRALNARDARAYREASEACFGAREAVASVADVLPAAFQRWLRMGRELFWAQAVFYAGAQQWDAGGKDAPPREQEEAFRRESRALAGDEDLVRTHTALAVLGARMVEVADRPMSKEKLEAAVDLIEAWRSALFGDAAPAQPPGAA